MAEGPFRLEDQTPDLRDLRMPNHDCNVFTSGFKIAQYDARSNEWELIIDGVSVGVRALIDRLTALEGELFRLRDLRRGNGGN